MTSMAIRKSKIGIFHYENNTFALFTGVCVCVFFSLFLYISQLFSSYPGCEMTRFLVLSLELPMNCFKFLFVISA